MTKSNSVSISSNELSALARAVADMRVDVSITARVPPAVAWQALLDKAPTTLSGWVDRSFDEGFVVSLEDLKRLHGIEIPDRQFRREGTADDVQQMLDAMIALDIEACIKRQLVSDGYFTRGDALALAGLTGSKLEGAQERAGEIRDVIESAVQTAQRIKTALLG